MSDIGTALRITSLVLLIIWRVYWHLLEVKADKTKPKHEEAISSFHRRQISKSITLLAFGVVGVQLLGIQLFVFPVTYIWLQIVGFMLFLIGFIIALRAGYDLGTNWARCYDYQVKEKQELVTSGVYALIRHPIYSALMLFFIGAELVVQSYLVFPYLLLYFAANQQAKWEEKLLLQHFGDRYSTYMKRTKRFIPFIW